MLEVAAVPAASVDRAEQLVQQVAVAVLHVDEVEAGVGGERGGVGEPLDEGVELVVGEHARSPPRARAVEDGVVVRDARLRARRRGVPTGPSA